MKKVLSLAIFLTLGISTMAHGAELESILGFQVSEKGVSFQVASGGCTGKSFFKIEKDLPTREMEPTSIKLIRLQEDYCEAYLPYGTTIHYSYQDLGINEGSFFRIVNPHGTHLYY